MDVEMNVKGMTCDHCVKTVKDAIGALVGVSHVDVLLDSSKVKVSYNQEKISLETICAAIEKEGYEVDR